MERSASKCNANQGRCQLGRPQQECAQLAERPHGSLAQSHTQGIRAAARGSRRTHGTYTVCAMSQLSTPSALFLVSGAHRVLWLEAAQADPVHSFSECRVSARANEPLFHSFALGGYSLPVSHVHTAHECRGERRVGHAAAVAAACQRRLALRARRVLGADGVGAARPGACGEPDHRLALRARRRGRCAPVHRAGHRWLPSPTRATR